VNATPEQQGASPDPSSEVHAVGAHAEIDGDADEPLYTAPPHVVSDGDRTDATVGAEAEPTGATHAPDIRSGDVTADLKPSAVTGRAKADEIIRLIKDLSEKLHDYVRGPNGALLKRHTVRGTDLFRKTVQRERTKFSSVDKVVWAHPALAQLIDLMRRTRPKATCAACRGEPNGCRACRGLGFVPDDAELLSRDEQIAFDLGDPFEVL